MLGSSGAYLHSSYFQANDKGVKSCASSKFHGAIHLFIWHTWLDFGIDNVSRGTLQTKEISFGCKKCHLHSFDRGFGCQKRHLHSFGGGENLDFFVEILPTFSVNISLNRSDCEKSFGLFKVNGTCLNRLYFFISFYDEFLRLSTSKMVNP